MEENVKEQHPPYNDEGTHRWTIPALGHVKLNWDTAICSQRGLIGLGVVVRDHEGAVLAVRSRVQDGFFEPFSGGGLGGRTGSPIWEGDGRQIVLEGDSKLVVDAVNTEGTNGSKIGHLVEDIKIMLQEFAQWTVQGVRKWRIGRHILLLG